MADGSDLLLDFNPTGVSDNPAGRQLLLAALLHQDRSTQWEAHFGSIERVTGGNACGTDQLAGSAQWKIKLHGVDKPLGLKAYTRFIQEQLKHTCPGSSPKPPLASKAPQAASIPGTSDDNRQPSAAHHSITQAPGLQHAPSTAAHAGPVLGLVNMNCMPSETSVLPGCGATQSQERSNTLLGPAVNSHSTAHQIHTSTKANTRDVAAVPSTAEAATAASKRIPRAANSSGGSTAECLQLQLTSPVEVQLAAAAVAGSCTMHSPASQQKHQM